MTPEQQEELDGNELLMWRAEVWLGHVKRHRENGDAEKAAMSAWEYYCITKDMQNAAKQLYENCKAGL